MFLARTGFGECLMDIVNFFHFKKEMKNEYYTRDSSFNKYHLKLNKWGNIVYTQLNCTDEDLMNANYDSEYMVQMKLRPIIHYLNTEMRWGEYLHLQITNFVDEETNEPSLSYGILFVFMPIRLTITKFLFNLLVTGGLIYGIIWGLETILR